MVKEVDSYAKLTKKLEKVPKEKLVVLDCFATWCGPCKRIAPFFDELASKYEDVLFLKGDIDKIDEFTTEFKVRSMPTFIFIKDMTVLDSIQGASQTKLEEFIKQNK